MKNRLNINLVVKERLDTIAEALKKEETDSSSILDEFERLGIEVKGGECKIKSGMHVRSNIPVKIPSFLTDKGGGRVLSQAEIQKLKQELKEMIDNYLQQEDDGKPLHLEDPEEKR